MAEINSSYTDKIQSVFAAQITTEDNVNGMMVRFVHESPYLFMIFDDGRWASFTLIRDKNGTAVLLHQVPPDLRYLCSVGLLTERDRVEQLQHEAQKAEDELRIKGMAELVRLQEKYRNTLDALHNP